MKSIFSLLLCFLLGFNIIMDGETSNENVIPENEVELGELLFFDPILSKNRSISCASCHKPEFAFADTLAFSKGVHGEATKRNTPSVMNMAFRPYFFYDGRVETLQEQAIVPIEDPLEMHLPFKKAVKRVRKNTQYQEYFNKIYGTSPDSTNILNAIAAFVTSLESNGSAPLDVWMFGKEDAMTESQVRGRELFLERAKCFDCHFSPDFTGDEFRNIGLYNGKDMNDKGRFEITKDSSDLGKFKVPGLRNVALTPPYMHNGRFKTLEEVVEYYDDPTAFISDPINIDTLLMKPLNLTDQEKTDLVHFLHALTDAKFPHE